MLGILPAFMRVNRFFILGLLLAASSISIGQSAELFKSMQWRFVGPFRGGRSIAVCGSAQRPKEYYFGATGGGIWKTIDAGVNWKPVGDGFFGSSSVGAITISPSNPDIVYAGTGERDIRGNISHGDGIYKSIDSGKTWSRIGLESTQTISRIVVHPMNPDILWVAVLGHVYGKNDERGVFKSEDGGSTWRRVLFATNQAGAFDIVGDVKNPNILLATIWDAWRTSYTMNSGGPNSTMMKSVDGGETWTDIGHNPGLPKGTLGKIGVSISTVDPNLYWANVEALDGGIFRSDDAGKTWTKTNEDRNWRQRAWYYTHIYADTKDKEAVHVLNVGWGKSTNGGKTFSGFRPPHGDNHDLWISPDDPKRMIEANDGGACITSDGGQTFSTLEMPTAQIYHVTTDNSFPYNILGAQQDNSSIRIPSRTLGNGISKDDWTGTAGGESGYIVAKPDEPERFLQMAKTCGREKDIVMFGPKFKQRFNFLNAELAASGGNVESVVECFNQISQAISAEGEQNDVWERASRQLLRNCLDLFRVLGRPIEIPEIYSFAMNEIVQDDLLRSASPRNSRDKRDLETIKTYIQKEFRNLGDKTKGSVLILISAVKI